MKKVGVVIDDWKIGTFTDHFNRAGIKFSQFNGPVDGCITLTVETDDVNEVGKVVRKANKAAKKSRLN